MSYLKSIVERHLSHANIVTPRARARFETASVTRDVADDSHEDVSARENRTDIPEGTSTAPVFVEKSPATSPGTLQNNGQDMHPEKTVAHPVKTVSGVPKDDLAEVESNDIPRPDRVQHVVGKHRVHTATYQESSGVTAEIRNNAQAIQAPFSGKKGNDLNPPEFPPAEKMRTLQQDERFPDRAGEAVAPAPPPPFKSGYNIPGEQFSWNEKPWMADFRRLFRHQEGRRENTGTKPQNVIKVDIGRIDIRAVNESVPHKPVSSAKPAMSLSDFLKNKNGKL